MQLTAAAVTPPAEHAARRPAGPPGRRARPQLMPALDLPKNSLAHNGGIVYNVLQNKQGGASLSTPISIRIPDGLASQLDGIARETDRPRSYIVQKALESYLEDYADLQIALDRLHDGSDEVITGKELRKKIGL
jgi:RHH-type rel operon transcriptional repressor/antitoxin RelB